ncbi:hypothetical protein HMPREF9278_0961 [Mobiluncus mulieris FB024-16]|nr:hypothetical protein HMPREF9278_0961 [Mobiluncus mulieris FB024-16]
MLVLVSIVFCFLFTRFVFFLPCFGVGFVSVFVSFSVCE